jgi:hypothetical protein
MMCTENSLGVLGIVGIYPDWKQLEVVPKAGLRRKYAQKCSENERT